MLDADLYRFLAAKPGNLFFSPYSISTALAMTYAGARGETEKQMGQVLHFGKDQRQLHSSFGELQSQLSNAGSYMVGLGLRKHLELLRVKAAG